MADDNTQIYRFLNAFAVVGAVDLGKLRVLLYPA